MNKHTHKIVDGKLVNLTQDEIAELEARDGLYTPPAPPPAPTKEELLAQLQALTAQINALE